VTLKEFHHARHENEVRAREERETKRVGVFLNDGLDDLLGRLVEAGVDDLKARVTQRSRDDFRAAIVSVETGFGDYDSVRALHQ
jgi:ribosomal protein S3AE